MSLNQTQLGRVETDLHRLSSQIAKAEAEIAAINDLVQRSAKSVKLAGLYDRRDMLEKSIENHLAEDVADLISGLLIREPHRQWTVSSIADRLTSHPSTLVLLALKRMVKAKRINRSADDVITLRFANEEGLLEIHPTGRIEELRRLRYQLLDKRRRAQRKLDEGKTISTRTGQSWASIVAECDRRIEEVKKMIADLKNGREVA